MVKQIREISCHHYPGPADLEGVGQVANFYPYRNENRNKNWRRYGGIPSKYQVDLIFFRIWNFEKYKVASTIFFSGSGPYFFCLQFAI